MRTELAKYADEIVQDGLGSILGVKRGDETDRLSWSQATWMKLVFGHIHHG